MPGFEEASWFYEKVCWGVDNYKVFVVPLAMVASLAMGIWIGYKRDHPKPNPYVAGERRDPASELEKSA